MRYMINGKEASGAEVQSHLSAELETARKSVYFRGSIFYKLEYIETVALRFMSINKTNDFAYFDIRLIAE